MKKKKKKQKLARLASMKERVEKASLFSKRSSSKQVVNPNRYDINSYKGQGSKMNIGIL